jgi:hypothetical protein
MFTPCSHMRSILRSFCYTTHPPKHSDPTNSQKRFKAETRRKKRHCACKLEISVLITDMAVHPVCTPSM